MFYQPFFSFCIYLSPRSLIKALLYFSHLLLRPLVLLLFPPLLPITPFLLSLCLRLLCYTPTSEDLELEATKSLSFANLSLPLPPLSPSPQVIKKVGHLHTSVSPRYLIILHSQRLLCEALLFWILGGPTTQFPNKPYTVAYS